DRHPPDGDRRARGWRSFLYLVWQREVSAARLPAAAAARLASRRCVVGCARQRWRITLLRFHTARGALGYRHRAGHPACRRGRSLACGDQAASGADELCEWRGARALAGAVAATVTQALFCMV